MLTMSVTAFLADLLETRGAQIIEEPTQTRVMFGIMIAGQYRAGIIFTDGGNRVQLLTMLGLMSTFGKKGLRRFESSINSAALDQPFTGTPYQLRDAVWWRLETILPSAAEAAGEVFDFLLEYAEDDLFRVDVVRGLASQGCSPHSIREMVSVVGDVQGFA